LSSKGRTHSSFFGKKNFLPGIRKPSSFWEKERTTWEGSEERHHKHSPRIALGGGSPAIFHGGIEKRGGERRRDWKDGLLFMGAYPPRLEKRKKVAKRKLKKIFDLLSNSPRFCLFQQEGKKGGGHRNNDGKDSTKLILIIYLI